MNKKGLKINFNSKDAQTHNQPAQSVSMTLKTSLDNLIEHVVTLSSIYDEQIYELRNKTRELKREVNQLKKEMKEIKQWQTQKKESHN
ncbi:hypothetical protein [Mycoplasmopsis pullorum]|uniref:Uncharacterized protein n=1 Tax=Mycoplasmopsis pullorum TaxID=48003 RepID=A0A1L4FSD1_9BACT|nr:hypothetical protein [Mycoplasmopsis pullorum]APJ38499.1 hypothetical protein BLA55_02415 [Mycoplasmopsis pullorum]